MWNPIRGAVSALRKKTLEEGPVSNTLQLCTSKHLGDYQWLAVGVVLFLVIGVYLFVSNNLEFFTLAQSSPNPDSNAAKAANAAAKSAEAAKSTAVSIAVALITAAMTMFNWVYQAANRRLGVVDLFASEISALCKVCIVTDFAKKSIEMRRAANAAETQTPRSFDTKESYTPVYDRGSADLQALDSNVVSAVTQFYTYRRTMVDCLHLAMAQSKREEALPQYDQMIYMQFLMYECALTSIRELIEFEPDKAENQVTVLCSALPLLGFLVKRHRKDPNTVFLYRRLRLRVPDYVKDVENLLADIDDKAKSKSEAVLKGWSKAVTTSAELRIRFDDFRQLTRKEAGSDVPDSRQPSLQQVA
jgi:hypothetical protein